MRQLLNKYDCIIFDCDGVILDSNNLKIMSMKDALMLLKIDELEIIQCCKYFKNNFGKSRFHHIRYFVENIISSNSSDLYDDILKKYSDLCETLYKEAKITPGFLELIENCSSDLYVASGSDQDELRSVFAERDLAKYFVGIYGSPTEKADNISQIIKNKNSNFVMIGDSFSDLNAAKINGIDFIAYTPFSNVENELTERCKLDGYKVLRSW